MKKVLAFMLTLALILSCTAALAADAVTLTYSEVNPLDTIVGKTAQFFKEKVEELTGGSGLINIQPSGVCQYAGYMGSGLHKLDSIRHLDYWTAVSHQCSCIWLLPHNVMLPPLPAAAAQRRADKKARQIAQDVRTGARTKKAPPKKPLNQLESAVWPKIAAGKAQKFAVSDACVACGQCARLCPRGNIRIEGGRAVIGGNCIQCLSCLQYCPQSAISIGRITGRRAHYHNPNVTAAELTEPIIHID